MLQWRALFLLALLAPSFGSPVPKRASPPHKADIVYRLPTDVVPESYDIVIKPDYKNKNGTPRILGIETFKGTVKIIATVKEATNIIKLHHGTNIEINDSDVKVYEISEESESIEVGKAIEGLGTDGNLKATREQGLRGKDNFDALTEIYTIPLAKVVTAGSKIKIEIEYSGSFEENAIKGFHYCGYKAKNDKPAALLATQFQQFYARKAFPCFDEPGMKATFDLSIQVTSGIDAIANTPKIIDATVRENDVVKFKTSPKMSSYLLAFIVYEKDSFSELGSNGKYSTWGRTEAQGLDELSNNDGPAMLEILKTLTDIDYYGSVSNGDMGMEKIDQAAVPGNQLGAMENWGLVIYSENALLYNKDSHNSATHELVIEIIAHELSHKWFGNLVTTKWWSTIWLNEGFADFFQHYIPGELYRDWKMDERMILNGQMGAFEADSSASSSALTQEVNSPAEIINHFGTITYSKGGSILRQIRNVLGEKAFEDALKDYLKRMAYSAAEPNDLFQSFVSNNNKERTKLENVDLLRVLENWTEQPGFPVITVEKGNNNEIKIKQDRYLLSDSDSAGTPTYDVYLTWFTDKSDTPTAVKPPQAWLRKPKDTITLEADFDWIIINPFQAGYYRVDYSTDLWEELTKALQNDEARQKIPALDRAALINNALNLARSSQTRNIDYGRAFKLMEFLRKDFEFEPWAAAVSSLAHVERLLINSREYQDFIKYIVENAYANVKFEASTTDSNVLAINRQNILTLACSVGYLPCLAEAQRQLQNHFADGNTENTGVHVDLQTVVYCYGLKGSNGAELWEKLWTKYKESRKDMAHRLVIASALGCVNDKDKLKKYLSLSLNEDDNENGDYIPRPEANYVFTYVYANPAVGVDAALDFLEENLVDNIFDKLVKRYGESGTIGVIVGLGSMITNEAQKIRLENVLEGTGDNYAAAIAAAEVNLDWLDTYGESVKQGMQDVGEKENVIDDSTVRHNFRIHRLI